MDVFLHIFSYCDIATIYDGFALCSQQLSILARSKGKMLPVLQSFLPTRIINYLTLQQVINLCHHDYRPPSIVMGLGYDAFLKDNKVYYRTAITERPGVLEVNSPPVSGLATNPLNPSFFGEEFCVTVNFGGIYLTKYTPLVRIIQAVVIGDMWYILDARGTVYKSQPHSKVTLGLVELFYKWVICCETLPPISYLGERYDRILILVDVNDEVWEIAPSHPPQLIGSSTNKKEQEIGLFTTLNSRGIRTDDVEEACYNIGYHRLLLVKNDGKIRLVVKHYSGYVVIQEDYEHFSF